MNVHRVLVTLACAAVLGGTAAARQVFKAGTDLVLLNVTVADAAGHLVTGLNQEDFQVYEDGVLQTVTNFSRDPLPIALSIALDTSTSMERKLPVAQEAAAGFVRRLTPKDVAQIIDFDSQAQILQPFTNDKASLEQAIRRTQAGGSTSLYNALYTALSELKGVRGPQTGEVRQPASPGAGIRSSSEAAPAPPAPARSGSESDRIAQTARARNTRIRIGRVM